MSQTETQAAQAPQSTQAAPAVVPPSPMLQRLYQLADLTVAQYVYEVGRYQPMNDSLLGPNLYKLAAETTLRSLILQKELLRVFCEPAAAELLLRLPNRYWFWFAIKSAVLEVEDGGLNKRLTQEHVAVALAQIRRDFTSKYNLRSALSDLSQSQVASRAVAGVILVRPCFGELDEIVFNPIFAPCPGTEGTLAQSAAALTAALLKD